jgi:CDP-glucose 4,6-dehydratase
MNKKYWRAKKVLITGHEGFLGSNITKTLVECGAVVIGVDPNIRRKETIFSKEDYKKFKTIKGSSTDYNLVVKILHDNSIQHVFHLGAEAIVGNCNKRPLKCFQSNIEGTWKLLEACRQFGKVKTIVVASSDKAYGSLKALPYSEEAPLTGDHPYDVSKACADMIANTYYQTYKLPVAIARSGNIYGPGDFNYSRLLPDAMRCSVNGGTFLIRSDGKYTRDYVYVDDLVNGYLLLAEKLQKNQLFGESFNFSDEKPITVLHLLKTLRQISGNTLTYKILNEAKYEIKHQYLSSEKARKVLGWKHECSLYEGINSTFQWYKYYYSQNK